MPPLRIVLRDQIMYKAFRRSYATEGRLFKKEMHHNGATARVVLCDSKRRNALSLEMIQSLREEMGNIHKNEQVRSVIIAAEGPAFCSGHDLKELTAAKGNARHVSIFSDCTSLMQFLQGMTIPVIAEVSGAAVAAGCQLACSCDIVVSGEKATFVMPGQKIGLFCSTPGIAAVRSMSRKVALDMLLTGRVIDAQEAQRVGLVSRLVPHEEVTKAALDVAAQIAEYSGSVTSLGKSFFHIQSELTQSQAYRYGGTVMTENLKLQDAQEGIDAFLEKRKPGFVKKA